MELIKVGNNTYYVDGPNKVGFYVVNNNVYLIDSGNDKDMARKVHNLIKDNGWSLKAIINTHSNADHIGGNNLLQKRNLCDVVCSKIERSIVEFPELESAFLYGAYPLMDFKNKFLWAEDSSPTSDIEDYKVDGLEFISLPGHYFGMYGIKTSDDVFFIADSLFDEKIIEKYHIMFLYDIKGYLKTLDELENVEAKYFIPSHARASESIKELIKINRNKVLEIISLLKDLLSEYKTFEEILKIIFDTYKLTMNSTQYILIGSTIKSYLSYLYNEKIISIYFDNNMMYYKNNN